MVEVKINVDTSKLREVNTRYPRKKGLYVAVESFCHLALFIKF